MNDKKSGQKEAIISDYSLSQVRGGANRVISQPFEGLKNWIGELFRGRH